MEYEISLKHKKEETGFKIDFKSELEKNKFLKYFKCTGNFTIIEKKKYNKNFFYHYFFEFNIFINKLRNGLFNEGFRKKIIDRVKEYRHNQKG